MYFVRNFFQREFDSLNGVLHSFQLIFGGIDLSMLGKHVLVISRFQLLQVVDVNLSRSVCIDTGCVDIPTIASTSLYAINRFFTSLRPATTTAR